MLRRMTETSDLLDLAGLIRTGDARKIRESAGITTETIAADLDVSAATVARWETGAISPSRRHAIAWLTLLRQIVNAP
jgi:DNA-binding transcriptional regulator YiaG